jgi:hypothetical protein
MAITFGMMIVATHGKEQPMRPIDADAIKDKAWKAESEACFYAIEDVVSVTDIDEAPTIRTKQIKQTRKIAPTHIGMMIGASGESATRAMTGSVLTEKERASDEGMQ